MNTGNMIVDIIRNVLSRPDQEISFETTAQDIPGWDSFAMVKMILLIEEGFSIEFDSEELDAIRNVGDLVEIVSEKSSLNKI